MFGRSAGTDCEVLTIFDQTSKGNDLLSRHPGRHFPVDYGVNASAQPVVVGGHHVYGAKPPASVCLPLLLCDYIVLGKR